MLKAIVVDDEQHCVDRLIKLLSYYKEEIKLVAHCYSLEEAKNKIESVSPDIVFLDVHLNEETGFDLLAQLKDINFEVIFTTAFDTYAVEAFRFSALDYLLKPVDEEEFKKTIQKIKEKENLKDTSKKLEVLFHNFENKVGRLKKVAIPTLEGLILLVVDDIQRLQSDGNYTDIFLASGKKITATKTLKFFEKILETNNFFRIHKSHFINMSYLEKYVKGKGGYVVMRDGFNIEVAVRRKEELLKRIMNQS